jgi:hypothetical protein
MQASKRMPEMIVASFSERGASVRCDENRFVASVEKDPKNMSPNITIHPSIDMFSGIGAST